MRGRKVNRNHRHSYYQEVVNLEDLSHFGGQRRHGKGKDMQPNLTLPCKSTDQVMNKFSAEEGDTRFPRVWCLFQRMERHWDFSGLRPSWKYGWLFVRSEFIFPPHLQTVSPSLPVLIIFSQSHFSSPSPYFSGLSFLDLVFYHSTPSWTFLPMEASKSCFQENKLPDILYVSSESSFHFWKLAFPWGTLPPAALIKNAALSPTLR